MKLLWRRDRAEAKVRPTHAEVTTCGVLHHSFEDDVLLCVIVSALHTNKTGEQI